MAARMPTSGYRLVAGAPASLWFEDDSKIGARELERVKKLMALLQSNVSHYLMVLSALNLYCAPVGLHAPYLFSPAVRPAWAGLPDDLWLSSAGTPEPFWPAGLHRSVCSDSFIRL